MNPDPFGDPFRTGLGQSTAHLFTRARFGGGVRAPRKPDPAEAEPDSEPLTNEADEAAGEEAEETPADKVTLKNPKWEIEEVGFNEETDISVEAALPESQAHKTRVDFELFAKTPAGPESVSKCQGTIEAGKAKGRIPVYIPQYKDEDGKVLAKVEYYFTAKHSGSDLLKDDTQVKEVDHLADRLIQTHILPDVTFATGKSFLGPGNAEALKGMVGRVKEWKGKHPDGKLVLFGHADAVGKEEDNKKLSERRAKSVHAFLVKDPSVWKSLHDEEKWGLATTQELLKHLGHEPGALDGKDGPKTQSAVKAFQGSQGMTANGAADAATREALYKAFMEDCNQETIAARDFDAVDGKPFAGCSEFNRAEDSKGACAANRRVALHLLKSNKNFPIQYPCKQGDNAPCRKQGDRKGERRTPGFACKFYDDLVVETAQGGGAGKLTLTLGTPYEEGKVGFKSYTFECAGTTLTGEVPADGRLQLDIPDGASEAVLKAKPEGEGAEVAWKIALKPIPPVEEVHGLQIRLNNLGFDCGPEDGILGKKTKVGLRSFQQRYGLIAAGAADDATRAKLKEVYGA